MLNSTVVQHNQIIALLTDIAYVSKTLKQIEAICARLIVAQTDGVTPFGVQAISPGLTRRSRGGLQTGRRYRGSTPVAG